MRASETYSPGPAVEQAAALAAVLALILRLPPVDLPGDLVPNRRPLAVNANSEKGGGLTTYGLRAAARTVISSMAVRP